MNRKSPRLSWPVKWMIVACAFMVVCLIMGWRIHHRAEVRGLVEAVLRKDIAAVRQFLERGVDPNASKISEFPLSFLDECQYTGPYSALETAAYMDEVDMVRLMLDHGANIHALDEDGSTPLHWAMEKAPSASARLLLERGANIQWMNRRGETPLHMAARLEDPQGVLLLLDRGADVNAGDGSYAGTPLIIAAAWGKTHTVETLLGRGANLRAKGNLGITALIAAADAGDARSIELFLKRGVNINERDEFGRTALMHAADLGRAAAVKTLLAHGADVTVKAGNGITALSLATGDSWRGGDREEVQRLLSKAGAKE